MNMFLYLLIVALFFSTIFLSLSKMFKYRKLQNKANYDVNKLIHLLTKLRYGHLDVEADNLHNKKLEVATNRLIETIADREKMINEYQAILNDKNATLQKMIANEQESQAFKRDFVATLTHDMKVPVIAELNSINFLLDGRFGEINEKQKEVLNLMKNSNQELMELAQTLLDVYKLEDNELKLNCENTNFNILINEVLNEISPIAENNLNTFKINTKETDKTELNIDSFNIKRVIKNLLANAISFSPKSSEILISTKKYDKEITFSVTNFGQGISAKELNLIFKKYYTGTSKFRRLGTGLGLYLSNKIMLAHNGSISVTDTENDKVTFVVTLPLKEI